MKLCLVVLKLTSVCCSKIVYNAFATRRCQQRHYVIELSIRCVCSFVRTGLVIAISREWLEISMKLTVNVHYPLLTT